VTPTRAPAPAKINLALVVGDSRPDGLHEVATIMQRVDLCDRISVVPAASLAVDGFAADSLVRRALETLADAAGRPPAWHARIEKEIPVAAGLGGGSSDAATALRLANETLDDPLPRRRLHELARSLGADVPFFLEPGPQLATGDGTTLEPLDLPQDYHVLLALPHRARKESTAAVYRAFDTRDGHDGFDERRAAVLDVARRAQRARDLAALPPNDLASSPLAAELRRRGAFRADVSGAGPIVFGLFLHRAAAAAAARAIRPAARAWLTVPAWYG
jgi:4-diphosphocytidyl-2-C-methyl-D-erythritol kinase